MPATAGARTDMSKFANITRQPRTMNSMTGPERLEGVTGRHWHGLDDGRIQCDVCPRYCKLNEGQRGLCFVRGRQDDAILLTTYGRSSGFCVDPIEKKPLNHYLPGTPVLSFGTAGCNLTCKFCQNWDISKARQFDRLQETASPEDIVRAAIAAGCNSIAYTYNDPVIFLEYAVDVARVARGTGSGTWRSLPATSPQRRVRTCSARSTRPMSTSRRSPRSSTSACAAAISPRSSKRWSI